MYGKAPYFALDLSQYRQDEKSALNSVLDVFGLLRMAFSSDREITLLKSTMYIEKLEILLKALKKKVCTICVIENLLPHLVRMQTSDINVCFIIEKVTYPAIHRF